MSDPAAAACTLERLPRVPAAPWPDHQGRQGRLYAVKAVMRQCRGFNKHCVALVPDEGG
jgi:hypothetical protein